MGVQAILDRLEKVRATGPNRWSACCPAHKDKTPSLSITETSEGKILLKCFAECDVDQIVGSIGMELSDLFPPDTASYSGPKKVRLITPSQALDVIAAECELVWTAAQNLAAGHTLKPKDLERLSFSASRIRAVIQEARS